MAEKEEYNNKIEANAQGKKEIINAKRIHFEKIDSTNSWAKVHYDQWLPQGVTLVTASMQTAGRGRFKRQWVSPPQVNIYATFCFWLDLGRSDIGHIPQLLALAAALALERLGFSAKIKWPNDILLNGKKAGGILCETILEGDRRGVVCGIGLNVNMTEEELHSIDRPATSLLVEGGNILEVESLLQSLKDIFIVSLDKFISQGFDSFFSLLQDRSFLKKGDAVRLHVHQAVIEAQFEALNPNGAVDLKLPDKTIKTYYAGELIP